MYKNEYCTNLIILKLIMCVPFCNDVLEKRVILDRYQQWNGQFLLIKGKAQGDFGPPVFFYHLNLMLY